MFSIILFGLQRSVLTTNHILDTCLDALRLNGYPCFILTATARCHSQTFIASRIAGHFTFSPSLNDWWKTSWWTCTSPRPSHRLDCQQFHTWVKYWTSTAFILHPTSAFFSKKYTIYEDTFYFSSILQKSASFQTVLSPASVHFSSSSIPCSTV